jgi:ATP adenylyltransferase
MAYVSKPQEGGTGNIFVDLPAADDDARYLILHRGQEAFVIMNAYPYTSGHLLVAPFRAVATIEEMTDSELLECQKLIVRAMGWLRKTHGPQGFNVGANIGPASGAGIPVHVHWHIVPRWTGDTNFMTTISDVRVIPQSLDEAYAKLKAVIDEDAG